jgi:hypothetical protein
LTIRPVEIKAWLKRDAVERSADYLAFDLERSRWQPYRLDRSRAAELDGTNDRSVVTPIDTAASGPSWTLSPDRTMMCARDFGRHHGRRGLAAEPARHHDRR